MVLALCGCGLAVPLRLHILVGIRTIVKHWKLISFSLLIFLILCGLGTWQIFRLHQKQALLTQIETGIRSSPQDIDFLSYPEVFAPVTASGHFLNHPPFLLKSKPYKGKVGQYLIAPFQTTNGKIILTLRGWIDNAQEYHQASNQNATLQGQIRYPDTKSWFHPENTPSDWYRIDPISMGKELSLQLEPYYILESNTPPPVLALPANPKIPNNHFAYIITWFSLAFALCVMVIVYVRKEARRGG